MGEPLHEGRQRGDLPLAFQQAVNEAVPLVQKQTEDALKLIEKGTRQSLDLLTQAFETGQAESPAKAQARLEELWETSLHHTARQRQGDGAGKRAPDGIVGLSREEERRARNDRRGQGRRQGLIRLEVASTGAHMPRSG